MEKVAALSEEQASKLYLSSRPADWCMDHVLISLELRRRNAFGKPLLTAMVEAKLRLSEELFDGSTEEGEDEAEDENGPLAPFDGRTMTLAEAKQWADLVNVQGQLQAADGKMRMRVWLGEHEATAEGSDLGTVQARAWSALRRKIEAGDR
ncbi:MAG: hypothetical protein JNK04_15185 [Myxococcales bacterium]|nr:hypothetical protein [Myxococcales bacterium]